MRTLAERERPLACPRRRDDDELTYSVWSTSASRPERVRPDRPGLPLRKLISDRPRAGVALAIWGASLERCRRPFGRSGHRRGRVCSCLVRWLGTRRRPWHERCRRWLLCRLQCMKACLATWGQTARQASARREPQAVLPVTCTAASVVASCAAGDARQLVSRFPPAVTADGGLAPDDDAVAAEPASAQAINDSAAAGRTRRSCAFVAIPPKIGRTSSSPRLRAAADITRTASGGSVSV